MKHKISFGAIALCFIAFFLISANSTNAKEDGGLCSRVGTWYGTGDQGYSWIAIDGLGQSAINGHIIVEWIEIDPTLGIAEPPFSYVVRVTNAIGIWKKVSNQIYQYTWVAYGLAQNGDVVYTARASGTAELVDCDNVDMNYVLEFWPGKIVFSTDPDDVPPDPILTTPLGFGSETRMPLVQATCQSPTE